MKNWREESKVFQIGYKAFMLNTPLAHNPFQKNSEEYKDFELGWKCCADECTKPIIEDDWKE